LNFQGALNYIKGGNNKNNDKKKHQQKVSNNSIENEYEICQR